MAALHGGREEENGEIEKVWGRGRASVGKTENVEPSCRWKLDWLGLGRGDRGYVLTFTVALLVTLATLQP